MTQRLPGTNKAAKSKCRAARQLGARASKDVVNATAVDVRERFRVATAAVLGAERAQQSNTSSTLCTQNDIGALGALVRGSAL